MENRVLPRDLRVEFISSFEQHLTLTEWLSVLTLCLAPLLAHLISGVPQVVYLDSSTPKWHDTIVLYNPVTIIWRYFAVVERCLTTSDTTPSELAAINVIYWRRKRWDGNESAVRIGKDLCIRPPPAAQARILSAGGLKTLIVALQGAAAIGVLLPGKLQNGQDSTPDSLPGIFLPLAFLGLLRLPAAYWLTDDYYVKSPFEKTSNESFEIQSLELHTPDKPLLQRYTSEAPSFEPLSSINENCSPRYQPRGFAIATRICYIIFLLFALGVALYTFISDALRPGLWFTLTQIWMTFSYIFFLVTGVLIYTLYFVQRQAQPVCIPCANTLWYKIHTSVMIVLALGLFIIAALETNKDFLGLYSSGTAMQGTLRCRYTEPNNSAPDDCYSWEHGNWGFGPSSC